MLLFDIKRFALHDGPGIRTTIFMKGCPLHCVWCHNPEGISPEPTRLFTESKCIHCGLHERGGAEACPTLALQIAGKEWTMEEIMRVVEKERKVMEDSDGGITICGGEPLMHPNELKSLLIELGRRGFHRTVDTTLYASWQTIESIIPHTDLFLVDIKHMDSDLHRKYTGVGNELILENIQRLCQHKLSGGKYDILFRLPLIEGVNADDENIKNTALFLKSQSSPSTLPFPIINFHFPITLLPYHDSAKAKHARMGTLYNPEGITMKTPSAELLEHVRQLFAQYDISVTVS